MAKNRAGATVSVAKPVPPGKFGIYWPTFSGIARGWTQAIVRLPDSGWEVGNAAIRAAVSTVVVVWTLKALDINVALALRELARVAFAVALPR